MTAPARQVRHHTPRDLHVYGQRYGIDYRFPALSSRAQARQTVVRGEVRELSLGPGMELVASDIEVMHRYDSRSLAPAALSIIVMLEGHASVTLGQQALDLGPGTALSVQLSARQGLQATQPAGQRIRALTLGLDAAQLARLGSPLSPPGDESRMRPWRLPPPLRQSLEQALATPSHAPAYRLLLEGLSLQLLAHGLGEIAPAPASRLRPQERQRLEQVRETLRADPAREHRLAALAALAVMSPATLRRKFQSAFGCSVFDYLRECRLNLAHDYLMRGHSVQQAAHFSGYRHASNLATAFRRHFGYAPSSLVRDD